MLGGEVGHQGIDTHRALDRVPDLEGNLVEREELARVDAHDDRRAFVIGAKVVVRQRHRRRWLHLSGLRLTHYSYPQDRDSADNLNPAVIYEFRKSGVQGVLI